jgi:hypothetical protein
MPEMLTVPAPVNVRVPLMITLEEVLKDASQSKAVKLTPALSVTFSVKVPGRMKIVCPEDAAVTAD